MLLLRCHGISSTLYLLAFVCLLLFVAACVRLLIVLFTLARFWWFGFALFSCLGLVGLFVVWLVCLLFSVTACCVVGLLVRVGWVYCLWVCVLVCVRPGYCGLTVVFVDCVLFV